MSLSTLKEKINNITLCDETESISNDIDFSNLVSILNEHKYAKDKYIIDKIYKIFEQLNSYWSFFSIIPYDFKYTKYYNFFDFMTSFIIDFYNINVKKQKLPFDDFNGKKYNFYKIFLKNLINMLNISNKGQHFLSKLLINLEDTKVHFNNPQVFIPISCSGTLMTYLFAKKCYMSQSNEKICNTQILEHFCNSLANTDSRLYKYFLKDPEIVTLIRKKIESDYSYMRKCLRRTGNISVTSQKYFLKRIKNLNDTFNIVPYYEHFIDIFDSNNFFLLTPYYITKEYIVNMIKNEIDYFGNYFYEQQEGPENFIPKDLFFKRLQKFNDKEVVDSLQFLLNDKFDADSKVPAKFISNIAKYFGLTKKNLSNKFLIKFIKSNFSGNPLKVENISLNYITILDCIQNDDVKHLYTIRHFLEKIFNIQKMSNYYVKKFTQKKEKVFEFNTIPPKHFLEKYSNSQNIKGNLIIRPKADGTLISSINKNVKPLSILSKYILKAEYIEEKDLYLVFDINLPGKTPLERYEYIRKLHPYTKNNYEPYKINSLDDITKFNLIEDKILEKFLSTESGTKWYPKASFVGKLTEENISLLTDVSSKSEHLHTKLYPNDGFVILTNNEALKIKPLDYMTIDITFNSSDRTWRDREGNNMSFYMKSNSQLSKTNIWRCYPVFGGKRLLFENREIRYDKRRANPNCVIVDIINYLNNKLYSKYYQQHKTPSKDNLQIIKRQNSRFNSIIKQVYRPNKTWLDLGCGKGKLLHQLQDIIIYFGLDNDNSIISNNIQKFRKNKRAIFKTVDVNEDILGDILPPLKFDYIVMNHSINHFYGKNLVDYINKSTKTGTYLIFNSINERLENSIVKINDGYIRNDGERTKYLFPWAHNVEVSEKYTKLSEILNSFSTFRVIEKKEFNDTKFESVYTWLILQKI